MEFAAFTLLLLVAEVLGTLGGFGSSMLVMPLAGWFLPFEQALGLTALFHVFSNGAKMVLFRRAVPWRLLLWLGVPAVIAVIIGAQLTVYMNDRLMSLVLGALLVSLSLGLLWKQEWRLRPTNGNALAGGALSGFMAGISGTGGAIRGITLAAFDLEKMVFVATSAWIDMGVDLSRSMVYFAHGFITTDILAYIPVMALTSFGGSWIGKRLLIHIPQARFRTLVLVLVLLMGIITIAPNLHA